VQDFRKLDIYNRAIDYCADIYKFSVKMPSSEKYGLISQIRRAGSSIPLNISEGAGSSSNKEFSLFISYAYRSINEVLTCIELVKKLNLVREGVTIEKLEEKGVELSRMIYSFFKKLGGKTYNL